MEWRFIEGTNGEYQVSDTGMVKTTRSGKIMTPSVDQRGYLRVALYKSNRNKRYKVHRLVAQAFLPNPEEKPQVNHKDGNKQNNTVCNLEWVTNNQNMSHARQNGLFEGHRQFCKKTSKKIIATNLITGQTIEYESILAAKREIGTQHIQEVLSGKRKQAKGYTFSYAREGDSCQR